MLLHQSGMQAYSQQLFLRTDHLASHQRCPSRGVKHCAQMLLVLLAQIQGPANLREHLGGHVEFFPVAEPRYWLEVVHGLFKHADHRPGTVQ